MGSYTSPIVISDDEDEAYVEMQLEDRFSDAVFDDGHDYYEEEEYNLEPMNDWEAIQEGYADYAEEGKPRRRSIQLRGVIPVRRTTRVCNPQTQTESIYRRDNGGSECELATPAAREQTG